MNGRRVLPLPLFCGILLLLSSAAEAADATTFSANCEISKGACSQRAGNAVVTLEIAPKPVKAMGDLTFTVTVKGGTDSQNLKLDLQMVGMDMGPNEVALVKTAAGRYTGKGVIPRCHSGRKLWSATVAIPGQPSVPPFRFNVL